jgi:hypothetical protein
VRRAPLLVAVLAGLLGLTQVGGTSAGFTDRAVVDGGPHTSGSMAPPALPTVSQVQGTGATRVAWAASAVGEHGAEATSYEVQRYDAAAGGTPTTVCTMVVRPGTSLACEDGARPAGTRHYAVTARFGASWRAESPRRAFAADLTGPTVVTTEPEDGYRGNAAGLRRDASRGCGTDTPGCGTATDPAGVTSVRWVLELRPSTGNRAPRCWNGTAFVVAGSGGCAENGAVTATVAGGLRWRIPGTADDAYRDRGTYTLSVLATDSFGSTTTVSLVATVT